MRKLLSFSCFLLLQIVAFSQTLTLEGVAPNLYLEHTVAPKENFYSIGRLYNQAPKTIAAYNNVAMEKGLSIGQHIKIPLNEQNYDISGKNNADEKLLPLTHTTAPGETLFRISNNSGVQIEQVKQWNKLSSDAIGKGSTLIVGFLKVKTDPMATVTTVKSNPATAVSNSSSSIKEVIQPAKEIVSPPAAPQTNTTIKTFPLTPKEDSAIVFVSQSPTPRQNTEQAVSIRGSGIKEPSIKTAPVHTTTTETIKQAPVDIPLKDNKNVEENTGIAIPDAGAFALQFPSKSGNKINNLIGTAASFKSTSGWQDKKYYALINDVAPGTIIKVTSSDKVVYAKVLGSMPEMKENSGLMLRLSNSAASHLGIVDSNFSVEIAYYQ